MIKVVKSKKCSKRLNVNCVVILVSCFFVATGILLYKLSSKEEDIANNTMQVAGFMYDISQKEDTVQSEEKNKEIKSEKIQELEKLQDINPDIVALIEIEGTNINYPVVQCNNNSFYITYDYTKKKSKDGAIFLDKDSSIVKPTTNLLIYGHNNIGSNEMFSDLIKYKSKVFYEKHKIIQFITNKEEARYEIISVFLSKVYNKSAQEVFKYYFFIDAKNEEEFERFVTNCKKLSLYKIEETAEFGDELMTLSTCEYSSYNGRLAVVAKKIK